MSNTDALKEFFLKVISDLEKEATAKKQKIPLSSFRFEVDEISGEMYAAHYFQYILLGRGPGKFPPPIKMTEWVEANPDVLARAKEVYRSITADQLGFLIGRKIAREGTDVFTGKKQPIDFLGVLEKSTPELLQTLARNELHKIATSLKTAIT